MIVQPQPNVLMYSLGQEILLVLNIESFVVSLIGSVLNRRFFFFQMLPLIKRSTDNLVAVIGEKAAAEESFDVTKYVPSHQVTLVFYKLVCTESLAKGFTYAMWEPTAVSACSQVIEVNTTFSIGVGTGGGGGRGDQGTHGPPTILTEASGQRARNLQTYSLSTDNSTKAQA